MAITYTDPDLQDNEKYSHQPNLSINSIASLVEPLTPPDINDTHLNVHHSLTHSAGNSYNHGSLKQLNHTSNNGSNLQGNYGSAGETLPSTPSSSLNNSIGGNTFRSRFKSLPLVSELDQKFNQFNITSLQNLSQTNNVSQYSPSVTNNSIPQIPLNQYQSASKSPYANNQRFQSLPSIKIQTKQLSFDSTLSSTNTSSSTASSTTTTTSSSNYKNYDELNLIPIENLDILKLSVDQYGCRYLQKKLEMDNSIKDIIFNKIFNNILDLIIDPFGNYLIQKMADYLTPYQKDLMIEKIHPYLFLISINQYGTRSLQKIIDGISNTYQMDLIVKGLQMNDTLNINEDNNIVKLIKDLNGNHVIQKCIFKFPPEKFQFIIDSICLNDNIVRISTHKHGCCVLQKLLNNANFDQILKISGVLLIYLDDLVNDQFGNYIIQFLFELDFLKTSSEINFLIDEFFTKIFQNLVKLSCLKFSSNVIEKFIKILKIKKNYYYLNQIIKLINFNFEILIKDKFGNYVIQTLIDQFYDVIELNNEMNILINTVKNYLPVIKAAPYARKIQLKIQQLETNYTLTSSSTYKQSYSYDQYQPHHQFQQSYGNFNGYDYNNHQFQGNFNQSYIQSNQHQQVYSNNSNNSNIKGFIPQDNGNFAGY